MQISQLVGSSLYRALADDSLKDEDNVAWVMTLAPSVRREWIERIGWIRLVDRWAENELLDDRCCEFQQFRAGWQFLCDRGFVPPGHPRESMLTRMQACWFGPGATRADKLAVESWDIYLQAISTYHQPNLVVESLEQYEQMLENLAGRFFQILPFLPPNLWQAACYFGMLDQFYNNLRDLHEDAQQGICYFPREILARFGVTREEILQLRCSGNRGYYQLIEFWLDEYLPRLREAANGFIEAEGLHPSWQILRDWSLARYRRIEDIFRCCEFNYACFPQYYWTAVADDLERWKLRTNPN
ncbi:squalene/phytoene synthase family protein [Oscillatoriales cyanobacterium LEGE 11467]|uniref:Squalene/phytoene synthase family protein n=1 Tax=Zarconia navalis LEGE 11467 TaxID=1828826 RepID=A0A928Z8L4_9CYAN|nr:squalene/phytoene synthase family protein [Zarconia navalis]MBE9040793.1 squalene/phytoene synthase family protein [Zarconia navalis LEGE 11467]